MRKLRGDRHQLHQRLRSLPGVYQRGLRRRCLRRSVRGTGRRRPKTSGMRPTNATTASTIVRVLARWSAARPIAPQSWGDHDATEGPALYLRLPLGSAGRRWRALPTGRRGRRGQPSGGLAELASGSCWRKVSVQPTANRATRTTAIGRSVSTTRAGRPSRGSAMRSRIAAVQTRASRDRPLARRLRA
jgi:hypothetical protein